MVDESRAVSCYQAPPIQSSQQMAIGLLGSPWMVESNMGKWLKTRRARAGFSFFGFWISIASNFLLGNHIVIACGLAVLAALFTVYLFWPELRMLKLTAPRNSVTESPLWLYLFGLASVGLLVFAFVHLYASSVHQPRRLTSTEFAQPYIGENIFTWPIWPMRTASLLVARLRIAGYMDPLLFL